MDGKSWSKGKILSDPPERILVSNVTHVLGWKFSSERDPESSPKDRPLEPNLQINILLPKGSNIS